MLLGVWAADRSGLQYPAVIAASGAILIFLLRKVNVSLFILGFLLSYLFHGLVVTHQRAWLSDTPREIQLTGTVLDTGATGNGPYLIEVFYTPESDLPDGVHLALMAPRYENTELLRGDIFSTRGRLELIPERRNPYGFDVVSWRHRQGADLNLISTEPIQKHGVSTVSKPLRVMENWKGHIRNKITLGLDPNSMEAQIIRAVVFGEKPPSTSDSADLMESFRLSGTLHVFAVSGLHVGMVALILNFTLSWLCAPRLFRISAVILGVILYAGITGFHPPAVRAAIMITLIMGGFLLKRKPAIINSLALSAIIVLLWDGHQLFTSSFQLSYGVLLSIALITGFWNQLLSPFTEIDPFMPRMLLSKWQTFLLSRKNWLKNSISVSLSAAIGSAPLIWFHFGILTPVSIIAGIPLMLIVFSILAISMVSLLIGSLIPSSAQFLNKTNAFTAKSAYQTASFFAEIPSGHWHKKPTRPENGRVIIFDMPYGGGANYLDLGGGVLLDSGRDDHFVRHVLPTLSSLRAQPDSLIISHADSLHSGGMAQCLETFQAQQTIIPQRDQRSPSFQDFLHLADQTEHPLITPTLGQIFPIEEDVYLEILHAPHDLLGNGKADDSGLVVRLHWQGWRILFTADAGTQTENRMLESGLDLSADIIVMGRNKNSPSGSEAFYQAVSPIAILASNSSYPETESIPASWRNMTEKLGIQVIDQLKTGAVTITLNNNTLTLTPTLPNANSVTLHR